VTRPTREQIEAARERLTRIIEQMTVQGFTGATLYSDDMADLRTLLAASAEPTDEELQAELRTITVDESRPPNGYEAAWYSFGARREGAR
jgi:hypothetical protein